MIHGQHLIDVFRQRAIRAGYAGYACRLHGRFGGNLVAHQANHFRRWADEDEAAALYPFGKVRVLGQEAIAGMDGHGIGDFGGADDRRHVEIALR